MLDSHLHENWTLSSLGEESPSQVLLQNCPPAKEGTEENAEEKGKGRGLWAAQLFYPCNSST